MDIIEKLKALEPDGLLWAHGIPGCYVISRAERDALLALVEPKTCATCRWFAIGERVQCPNPRFPRGAGKSIYPAVTATFGCTLHEPAPPSPRPSPSSETPETRA